MLDRVLFLRSVNNIEQNASTGRSATWLVEIITWEVSNPSVCGVLLHVMTPTIGSKIVETLQRFLLNICISNNWLKEPSLFFIIPPFPPFNVVHLFYLCPANYIILLGQHWYGGGGSSNVEGRFSANCASINSICESCLKSFRSRLFEITIIILL